MSRAYWNEEIETMPVEELERYEAPLLTAQVAYLYNTSPFYRHKLSSAGLQPDDITCREALQLVPFTEKQELADLQRQGELIGPHLCAPRESIVRLVGTGGTSGRPLRIAWTHNDIGAYNEMGARALWAMGCRPGDLVVNCFNYSVYAGGVMDHMSFETLGATVLAYGVGKSRQLLDMMAGLPGAKCLYATPSYALRLTQVASQAGIDPRHLGVTKGFFSGEAGLQLPALRQRLESSWGMSSHDLYGVAELGCQSGECAQHTGLHFCGAGLVLAELIDPDSGNVKPMRDGETGELVYTALKREACPLLRLRSRDFVRIQTTRCGCGRTSFRFDTLGRSDDMFVVKGVNVFPTAVHNILIGFQPHLTGEFQIVLDQQPPFDYAPRLLVEAPLSLPSAKHEELMAEIRDAIGDGAGFAARVELVPQGTIGGENKARRVLRQYEQPEHETHDLATPD